jgi:hypothetical protein
MSIFVRNLGCETEGKVLVLESKRINQFPSKCAEAPTPRAKKDWTRSKFLLEMLGKPLCNIIFIFFKLG